MYTKLISVCLLFLFLYSLYFYEILNNFVVFNKSLYLLNLTKNNTNVILLNNLNNYHPFLFYLNTVVLYFLFVTFYISKNQLGETYQNKKLMKIKSLLVLS